ncbi:MAG: PspC domain-containing protein [Frankiaceae bacterium]|nr:PspC domain-containing protein [Frankiaceae bacterium]
MTETTEHPSTDEPAPAAEPLFVRPREGRLVGGVCAGIANRWNVDVTLVRIAAVVLALLTGAGVLGYVAAWLLTPSSDRPARLRPETFRTGRLGSRLPALLLIVLVGLALAALGHALWWGAPTGLLVVAILVALVVGTRRGRWLLVSVAALLAVALGATAAFGSHFGTRTFHVASVDDLQDQYDFGVGTVRLDLSALTVTDSRETEVHLGRGNVYVVVPSNAAVVVHARAGIGSVTVDGHEVSGIDAEQTQSLGEGADTAQNRLVLNIVVGVGDVTVRTG